MKNIIGSLFLFFAFVNTSIAITDNREYVDWKDYPNIVKITSSGWKEMAQCTGTEIGKYVITAAHCVEGFDKFKILKNNDVQIDAKIKSVGNAKIPRDDWAILSLPYETESKYELSENLSADSGTLYGFGALRILNDEELSKVRKYLNEQGYVLLDADKVVDLLHADIPDVGYIYNDGDRLKKSPCSGIRKTDKGIEASCFSSSGNSGGGMFVHDNKIIGIDSFGDIMNYGSIFAFVEPVKNAIQHIQSGMCDENFVVENIFKKQINYRSHKKIGDYYILSGDDGGIWSHSLRDLCGNIIFEYVDVGSPKSIEYSNGVYKFIQPLRIPILSCAYGNGLNKVLASKVEDGDYEEIVLIDENDSKSESKRMSIDGGKTFYNSLYDLLASMFTQQEINEMPEDWKKCLKIINF